MKIVLTGNTTFKLANFREGLIKHFINEGHDVIIVSPNDEYVPMILKFGCKHIPITLDRSGTSPISELKTIFELFRAIREANADYVLSFTIKNNIYAGIICRILRKKIVANVTGLGPSFDSSLLLRKTLLFLYKISMKNINCVFFQNKEDMEFFTDNKLIAYDKAQLLPGSGVDLKKFTYQAIDKSDGNIVFLMISRIIWEKGIGEFVAASKVVQAKFPKVKFQILGPLEKSNKNAIDENILHKLLVEGSVEYLGATGDVKPYIESSHCVVLPTYYREGTPRSLIEAGAVGRPVITTDIPGCRDLVIDKQTGILVPPRNVDALTHAIETYIKMTHEERIIMGKCARSHIEKDFSEEIIIQKYNSVIKQCVN